MSRRPKPTAIRKLEGNVGHHRALPGEEPKPQIGKPEMPKGMGTAAKRHWRRYVHNLMLLNVLTVVDGQALEQACRCAALAEKYGNAVNAEPIIDVPIFDEKGSIVAWQKQPNKLLPAYLATSKTMKAFQIEFGLTPASRVKLRVEKKPDDAEQELPTKENTVLPGEEKIDLSSIDETLIQ